MTADLLESIRQRVLSSPDSPAPLAMALHAEMPWLEGEALVERTRSLYADLYQLGVLTPLLADPRVTDILVNAPDEIWVVADGPPQRVDVRFPDEEAVRTLASRLAALSGRLLDDAHPFVDLEFDGLRIHALLPPLAARGTTISIRRILHRQHTLAALVPDEVLRGQLEEHISRRANFLISGGTGSGKTTLLAAMLRVLPSSERVIVIEDTREIAHDDALGHCISLQTRMPNAEGRGAVSMRDLIRQSLRMRPDRIIVGEARGAEIVDLLAALNTGHSGSGGTVHARSVADVPARIEALAVFAGLTAPAAHSLLLSSIDIVIHLRHARQGRGIESIARLAREGDRAVVVTP